MSTQEELSWITDEDCKLQDNAKLIFGDGSNREAETIGDIYAAWNGSALAITQAATDSAITWGVDGAGIDQTWYGDTASAYMKWDQSVDDLIFAGAGNISMLDDTFIRFGTGNDVTTEWDTSTTPDQMTFAAAAANTFIGFSKDIAVKVGGDFAGSYATGSAMPLDGANTTAALAVFCEGTSDLTSAYMTRAIRGRHLVVTSSATINQETYGIQGQLAVKSTTLGHLHGGVLGTVEVSTAATINNAYAWGTACVIGRLGTGTSITTSTTGVAGFSAIHNAGALASGSSAAFVATKTGSTAWSYGLFLPADSCTVGVQVGTLGSNITSGFTLGAATSLNGFYADDGGADQTASTVWRNVTARTYYSVDQTLAAADAHVIRGHLKAASGVDFGGDTSVKTAIHGYGEFAGATTIGAGSFYASVLGEVWTDGNFVGTGKAAGVMSRFYSSAGTVSGKVGAFMATKQWSSTQAWPAALYVDAADYVLEFPTGTDYECGVKVTAITGIDTGSSAVMRVKIGATAYYVPLFAAAELDGE